MREWVPAVPRLWTLHTTVWTHTCVFLEASSSSPARHHYSAGTLPAIELSSHSAMDIGSMQSPNVARNIMRADGITQSPDRVCVGFVLLQIVPKEDTLLLLLDDSLHLQIICHL